MRDSQAPTCPQCQAPIPADGTDQLCPACLMSAALVSPDDETLSAAPGQPRATPHLPDLPRDLGGYRLLGLLGTGGMGTVYEAEHLATGRRVALKMLAQQLDSPEMRQRFLREGRLAASVSHPNSLYVFGSEEIESAPVITMEIAGGGTLKDKLHKRGPLPVASAVDAMLDVIAGLESAFASGVLHRDVKPSNCFLAPDGSVKVGDFGLSVSTMAKDDSYVTASGVIMGTPAYASPEQLRGDDLDLRADIYSVGATLFTLLTGRAPFEGANAVQVVANAVNQAPEPVRALREEVPQGLEQVVARCLAKEPEGRYESYMALRNALLPFSSQKAEPASLELRASAGWIDYLIAFLVPYVPLMLLAGNDEFHLRFLMERSLPSARYYLAFLGFGLLYFAISEGIWGAGLGKRLKGLRVVRTNGRRPGFLRALLRILIPVLSIEGVRVPLLLVYITSTRINDLTTSEIVLYFAATAVCPWIPVLLGLFASRENEFATPWDRISGTRVVIRPKGTVRPSIEIATTPEGSAVDAAAIGPYTVTGEILEGEWLVASDSVLRRRVWLLRRRSPDLPLARRILSRPGRLRWLQKVESAETTWDAYEAPGGRSLPSLIDDDKGVPWASLRHWLYDLASEIWRACGDQTLPAELSLDNVWVTSQGRAVLLDSPWPDVPGPAESIPVADLAGQQRFLSAVASRAEATSLPLHARPVLQNLAAGRIEKISFLTGILRGFLDKPEGVSRGIRAGAIFMMPLYIGVMIYVGAIRGAEWLYEYTGDSASSIAMAVAVAVLVGSALVQLMEVPFRTTCAHATFRLAVINARGQVAGRPRLLARWAIAWLPLLLPLGIIGLAGRGEGDAAYLSALAVMLLWIGAAGYAVAQPNRGWHDRLAGTWVVRR